MKRNMDERLRALERLLAVDPEALSAYVRERMRSGESLVHALRETYFRLIAIGRGGETSMAALNDVALLFEYGALVEHRRPWLGPWLPTEWDDDLSEWAHFYDPGTSRVVTVSHVGTGDETHDGAALVSRFDVPKFGDHAIVTGLRNMGWGDQPEDRTVAEQVRYLKDGLAAGKSLVGARTRWSEWLKSVVAEVVGFDVRESRWSRSHPRSTAGFAFRRGSPAYRDRTRLFGQWGADWSENDVTLDGAVRRALVRFGVPTDGFPPATEIA